MTAVCTETPKSARNPMPEETENGAGWYPKVDPVQGDNVAEALDETLDDDGRVAHGGCVVHGHRLSQPLTRVNRFLGSRSG